jgi:prepilin-type N-terminal cleavage/methylation domain-containing protein
MEKQRGYTAIEVLMVLATLASLAVGGAFIFALVHFVSKFW